MAMIVHGPDGAAVSFPDGTDDATINAAMAKAYPQAKGATPPPPPPSAGAKPQTSFTLGLEDAFMTPLDNAATAVEAGARKIGIPVDAINAGFAKITGQQDASAAGVRAQHQQYLVDQAKQGRVPSLPGEIVGAVPASIVTAAVTKNPYAGGAIMSAAESHANTLRGLAADTGEGAVFGKVGEVIPRVAGAVVKPVFRPAVNRLLQKGVPLTPGQIAGGAAHKIEDASRSIPILGDVVTAAQNRSLSGANVAVVNDALQDIGTRLPPGVQPGHQAIAYGQHAFGKAYDAITPHMRITQDAQLNRDLSDIATRATQDLPRDHATILRGIINNEVVQPVTTGLRGTQTSALAPTTTGDTLKVIDGVLNDTRRNYQASPNPHDRIFADYMDEVKQAVHSAASRQNPQLAAALSKVDQGYSKFVRAEKASTSTPSGIFGGAQLHTAVKAMDPTIRKRATAAGKATMQQNAEDMSEVLKPSLGDSGTATRWLLTGGAAALLGSNPHMAINPLALGAATAALAPYTKVGGKIVRAALTARPAGAGAVRGAIERTVRPSSVLTPAGVIAAKNRARLRQSEQE